MAALGVVASVAVASAVAAGAVDPGVIAARVAG
jgi:hypothetical protein